MNIKPEKKKKKLEKLSFGDLCFFDLNASSCAAIKVNEPEGQFAVELLVLGPSFPKGSQGPALMPADNQISVMSFLDKYTIRFATTPKEWSLSQPAGEVFIATDGTSVYFRLLASSVVFINLGTGEILNNKQPKGPLAYTKHWEIGIEDGEKFQTIVKSVE